MLNTNNGIEKSRFPLKQIRINLPAKYLERVLYRVKEHYRRATTDLTQQRSKLLDRLFNLSREERRVFEKTLKKSKLVKPGQRFRVFPDIIRYMFIQSDEVADAVLELWMDSSSELFQFASKELKRKHDITGIGVETEKDENSAVDAEVIQRFKISHPDFVREDIALMFSCLTGAWPSNLELNPDVQLVDQAPDGQVTDEYDDELDDIPDQSSFVQLSHDDMKTAANIDYVDLSGTKWESWLREADQIHPSDDSWDTARGFVQHFDLLIDRKLTERSQSRITLAETFALLSSEFVEDLRVYGTDSQDYVGWETWDIQLCPFDAIPELTAKMKRLYVAFHELADLKSRIGGKPPIAREEFSKLISQLGILHDEIISLYTSIGKSISPLKSGNEPPRTRELMPELRPVVALQTEQIVESLPGETKPVQQIEVVSDHSQPSGTEVKESAVTDEQGQIPIGETELNGDQRQQASREPSDLESSAELDRPVFDIADPELNVLTTRTPPSDVDVEHSIYSFSPHDTAEKIAAIILGLDGENELMIRDLVWRLIYEEKLDLAYAVARFSDHGKAEELRLPPWLVSCLTLGPHILINGGEIDDFLSASLKQFKVDKLFIAGQKEWNQAVRLLTASITMRAALVAPRTNAPQILLQLQFTGLPSLFEYCKRLAEMERSHSLDFETLKGVKEYVSWKNRMDTLRKQVQRWRKEAPTNIRIDYQPALRVWQSWQKDGLIQKLLDPIIIDAAAQVSTVEQLLERYSDEKTIRQEVNRTDRDTLGRPPSKPSIDFKNPGVLKLLHATQVALQFARNWVDMQKTRPQRSSSYLQRSAEQLGAELLSYRQTVVQELESFAGSTSSILIQSGIRQCRRTLDSIWALFDPEFVLPDLEPDLNLLLFGNLLRVTSLTLNDEWNFESNDSKYILTEILKTIADPKADWQRAFEVNKDVKGDHVATARIIDYLQLNSDPDPLLESSISLSQNRERSLREWRDALRQKVERTKREVERGYANDWLKQDESDNYQKRIQGTRKSLEEVLRFANKISELDEIHEDLSRKLKVAQKRVQTRFEKLRLDPSHPGYKRVQSALEKNDFSTANEYIDILQEGEELPEPEDNTDFLRNFFPQVPRELKKLGRLSRSEIVHKLRTKQTICGIDLTGLSDASALEASEMAGLWFDIQSKGMVQTDKIEKLFSYLGFSETKVMVSSQYSKRWWLEAHTRIIRDKKVCPVPTYGSGARGRYRVFCVFDDPIDEELFNAVGETLQRSVIVLYFGLLSEHERVAIAQQCRSPLQQRTFIIIDFALMLYLSTQPTKRLRALFDCSLPFTWLQPYVPMGQVPFETFYGRKAEKIGIMDPNGPCFIYGGKRLGKTALLYEVVEEFHKPEENRISIFIDLKEAGIGYNLPIDYIWPLLVEKLQGKDTESSPLKNLKIFPSTMTSRATAETLLTHIQHWLEGDNTRRILILLDEADLFLERDGEERSGQGDEAEFIRVHRIMKVWERTQGRFKIVFAGLHNVLRTTKVVDKVNPSLLHFGEAADAAKCIGPLVGKERHAALSLVKRPFFSLGYRFESEDLILRIMSHTNWYPSLIQLYCNQLLKHLNQSHTPIYDPKQSPPYIITSHHIDDVYRKILHTQLKDRFKSTLQLDNRYKVIAYSIAYRLLSDEKPALAANLTVEEIQHEALKWWSEGFRKTGSSTEESFRALLDEMDGLGIVRTDGEGQYTLRSLNIFSILGKEKEIEMVLNAKHTIPSPYEAATFRSAHPARKAGAPPWKRSPLTAQQVDQLQEHKNGASLIFGSSVAGLDDLGDFLSAPVGNNFYARIHEVDNLEEFVENLKSRISKRESQGVTLIEVSPECAWNYQWVNETLNNLSVLKSEKSWVRVAFVADPYKAWQIIRNNATELFSMVRKGLTLFSLTPWHDAALSQWLDDCNFSVGDEDREWIKYVSNNWPLILEELPQLEASSASWIESMENFAAVFDRPHFAKKLFHGFGLNLQEPQEILKVLAEYASPLNTEDLIELTSKPVDLVKSTLRWAELLMLILQGERETWSIDPVVARVLKDSTVQKPSESIH